MATKTSSKRIDEFLAKQKNFATILSEKNDRSAVIRTSAVIEESLTFILHLYFDAPVANAKRGISQTSRLMDALFSGFGPLSTFSGKILLSDALGLLSLSARHDLNLIKKIRNSFAHDSALLNFITPEIAQLCDALMLWRSAQVLIDGLNLPIINKTKFVLSGMVLMLELAQASKVNLSVFKSIVPTCDTTLNGLFSDLQSD